jgi:hypothetical protein
MVRMAVITKTFAPDFDLCASLNRSVLENSSDTIHHHIIAPRSDLKLFARLAGSRTKAAFSRSRPNICTSSGTGDRLIGAIRTLWTAYTGMPSLTNMNRSRLNPSLRPQSSPTHSYQLINPTTSHSPSTGNSIHVLNAGVEDLSLKGGSEGALTFQNAAHSWAKNIEKCVGAGLGISGSFNPWPWVVNPTNGSLPPTKARFDDGTYFCNSGC